MRVKLKALGVEVEVNLRRALLLLGGGVDGEGRLTGPGHEREHDVGWLAYAALVRGASCGFELPSATHPLASSDAGEDTSACPRVDGAALDTPLLVRESLGQLPLARPEGGKIAPHYFAPRAQNLPNTGPACFLGAAHSSNNCMQVMCQGIRGILTAHAGPWLRSRQPCVQNAEFLTLRLPAEAS